jgi:hypothetical protein
MKIVHIICLLFVANVAFTQCPGNAIFSNSFFERVMSKNCDTIYFTASFQNVGKVRQRNLLSEMNRKQLLKKADYKTAISIIPMNSQTEFYMPFKDVDPNLNNKLYNNQSKNKQICVRALIFKGYTKYDTHPFFVIDKVWFIDYVE